MAPNEFQGGLSPDPFSDDLSDGRDPGQRAAERQQRYQELVREAIRKTDEAVDAVDEYHTKRRTVRPGAAYDTRTPDEMWGDVEEKQADAEALWDLVRGYAQSAHFTDDLYQAFDYERLQRYHDDDEFSSHPLPPSYREWRALQEEREKRVMPELAAPPATPEWGYQYFDTTLEEIRLWNGEEWVAAFPREERTETFWGKATRAMGRTRKGERP